MKLFPTINDLYQDGKYEVYFWWYLRYLMMILELTVLQRSCTFQNNKSILAKLMCKIGWKTRQYVTNSNYIVLLALKRILFWGWTELSFAVTKYKSNIYEICFKSHSTFKWDDTSRIAMHFSISLMRCNDSTIYISSDSWLHFESNQTNTFSECLIYSKYSHTIYLLILCNDSLRFFLLYYLKALWFLK